MSKVSYLGSTSLKDLPTGLLAFLAQVELEESKKGKGVSVLGSIPLGHCSHVS